MAGCLLESGVKKADIAVNLARWMGTPERIGGKGYRCSRRRKVWGPRGRRDSGVSVDKARPHRIVRVPSAPTLAAPTEAAAPGGRERGDSGCGPFKHKPRPLQSALRFSRRRHHDLFGADHLRQPLPRGLPRRARAHLSGGEARRRAAAARGRDRAALREEGLQAGGAEAGAGLRGAVARTLRRAARAPFLRPPGQVHGLRAGGGHGVAGFERRAHLAGSHRSHGSCGRASRHHPRGFLYRGRQERDSWQRFCGERPP